MSQTRLADEHLPKLTEIQEIAVLDRAKQLVLTLWGDLPDPVLAMAMQTVLLLSLDKAAALATIEAMRCQLCPLAA